MSAPALYLCPHCDAEKPGSAYYWRDGKPRVGEGCKECRAVLYHQDRSPEKQAMDNARHKARNDASMEKAEARYQRWTDEDEALLLQFWPDDSVTLDELAAALGRTVDAIGTRVVRLRQAGHDIPNRATVCMKNRPLENA